MYALIKTVDDRAKIRYPITRILQRLGRDPSCDIFLDDENVSRVHAELTQTEEGIFLNDLASTNGTFVNGNRIHGLFQLTVGDRLQIGPHDFLLVAEEPSRLQATIAMNDEVIRHLRLPSADFKPEVAVDVEQTTVAAPDAGLKTKIDALSEAERSLPRLVVENGPKRHCLLPLVQPELEIGRSPECHLVLPDNQVSAHHAKIVKRKGGYFIYDNRSLNGLFVNNAKVRGVPLQTGDLIRLGDTTIRYEDPTKPRPVRQASTEKPAPQNVPSTYGPWRWVAIGGVTLLVLIVVLYWLWA